MHDEDRPHSDDALEWQVIASALARRTATAMGRHLIAELEPLPNRAEVERCLAIIAELQDLTRDGTRLPLSGIVDLRELLTHADKDGVLEPLELVSVGRTLEVLSELRRQTSDLERSAPRVHALCVDLEDHWPLCRAIAATFDAQGLILDEASADLGELRRRASRLREEIKEQLDGLLERYDRSDSLQERYVTLRSDRYVVPVRADHRGDVAGIVHDTSNSGQTLFIEPQVVVDLGNRLKISQAAVLDEEQRILRRLTARLVDSSAQLRQDLQRAAVLDSFVARARLSADLDAEAPVLVDTPMLELRQARHPALVLAARERRERGDSAPPVVANDIVIGGAQQALVISGPNAGGKTVALKAAGLCARMLRAGLPIPALGSSRCALFDGVHAVVGDAQSIATAQSTFSSHMLALDAMLQTVQRAPTGHRTALCLIDEIAHATDPAQGSCLGQALLEALVDAGALVIATTHYEALKALALSDPRFRNASVTLDADNLRPTYRIHLDLPGASSAFAIAQALGVTPGVVERARALAGEQARRLEAHIEALADEKERMVRARQALDDERTRLALDRAELEDKMQGVAERERQVKRQAREELLGDVRRSRKQVADIVAGLQGRPTPRQVDQAAHQLKEIEQRIEHRLDDSSASRTLPVLAQVKVGERVHVLGLGQDGQVVSMQGSRIEVQVGALRTRVGLDGLRAAQAAPPSSRSHRQEQRRREASARSSEPDDDAERPVAARTPRTAHNTLDLRGQRVAEALEMADRFFDDMLRQDVHRVFLLHGHGTGALRQALRQELPASQYVRRVQAAAEDDGGEAFTVVDLG
ncbi:MAG: endonuclease MutS2 [Pseudomonadota bacterium]